MKTKSSFLEKLLVAGIVALATVPFAHAVPSLRITDGMNTVTIADSGSGDLNPFEGAVSYIGSLGNFFLNVSTGISKPLLGSAARPFLELNSVDISGKPGILTILFSDTSFTPIDGGVLASIVGDAKGTIEYSTYADASNALFGTSLLLTSQTYEDAFSGVSFGSLAVGPTFSLTQKIVITHPSSLLASSFFDAELKAVPDGGSTVALLGAVLVGLEGFRRKFRGAKKIA